MKTWAILLAAGRGSRLAEQGIPKQFLPFEGAPLFWRSALTFSRLPGISGIVFVFPPRDEGVSEEDAPSCRKATPSCGETLLQELDSTGALGLPWIVAYGGERRQDSVASALAALPVDCEAVLVHDSARPFASPVLMSRVLAALASGHEAVIPGIAVTDTIKAVDKTGRVAHTPDRSSLRAVQTPQGFALAPLCKAHARSEREGWDVTDDAMLMERCGLPILIVEGEESNKKITTPEDLALLGMDCSAPWASARKTPSGGKERNHAMLPCTGLGYDVHRYGGDRPFILGGVPISCDVSIAAHSDGDTLLHAVMDAMLGCIGGGDIGGMFPDSDPAFDNISSGILLSEVLERTRAAGLDITNVDITVVAQTPRIAPHRQSIAANVAKLLQLPARAVNVKATTEEKLGFTGEKKGIKVMALVSGLRPAHQPS